MIRIAVVGAGSHSELHHGPSLQDCAGNAELGIELSAVCDINPDRAARYAESFGFGQFYTSIYEMLDLVSVDAIVAVTPVRETRRIVGDLLEYGIPLLLEKPPGRSAIEAGELCRIAAKYSTPTMVSFNRRYVPAVQKAAAWLRAQGAAGAPRKILAQMLRSSRNEKDFIVGTAIHLVDTVLSFMGVPAEISSQRWETPQGGQSCEARLIFEDGVVGTLFVAPDSGSVEERYEISGDGYTLQIEALQNRVIAYRENTKELEWELPADTPLHVASGCLAETEAFIRAVSGEVPYSPVLTDAAVSLETAISLDEGPRVKPP